MRLTAQELAIAVHALGQADKADAHLHKQVINQAPRVTVIPGKTGKVFHHNAGDFPAHYIGQEPLETFTLRVSPGVPIVHILGIAFKFFNMVMVKVIEYVALIFHAVAIVQEVIHRVCMERFIRSSSSAKVSFPATLIHRQDVFGHARIFGESFDPYLFLDGD